jgi:hypothetical protein
MKNADGGQTLRVRIERDQSGMFFATSTDEPTLFIAQTSRKALMSVLPGAVETTFLDRHHRHVTALPVRRRHGHNVTVRLVEREELRQFA